MNYSCDLDLVKSSFSCKDVSAFSAEIAKQMASIYGKPELFMAVEYALRHSHKSDHFIIEDGVMIANALIMQIDHPIHMLYRFKEPVILKDASDDQPVDIGFVLLSPQGDGPLHLRRLSRLSRMFKEDGFLESVRQAESEDTLRSYFMYPEDLLQRKANAA